jgi:outer membrane receptor protein involved in Fe transport
MNLRSRFAIAAMLGFLSLAAFSSLGAQGVTTGAIAGTVTDQSNNPLSNAQIQVTNKATGATSVATTRENGRYNVMGLEVGSGYTVTARRIGFAPVTREGVIVTLSNTTRIEFKLTEQAAQISVVTVTASNDGFESSNTGTKQSVTDTVLQRLPTSARQLTDFIKLVPQVSTSGSGYSAGGMSNRMNNVQIDGATERDVFGLGSTGQPGGQISAKSVSLEAVKEFQVLLAPFDVRQGNFGGLLLNAVTKSGTNEFHGSLFYDFRSQDYGRNTPVLRSTKFDQTQIAFSVGGPIIKDKLHFFLTDEIKTVNSPLAGPYEGQPANAVPTLQVAVADMRRFEQIMASAPYSIPALGTSNVVNRPQPQHNPFVRLDYKINDNHRLVARLNYGDAREEFRTQNGRVSQTMVYTSNAHNLTSKKIAPVVQLYSNFKDGSSNELFVGFTSVRDRRVPVTQYPQITVFSLNRVGGGAATIIGGSDQFSMGNEGDFDTYELTNNWTKNFGTHTLTVGTRNDYNLIRNLFTQSSYGVWGFRNLDSLAAGNANSFRKAIILDGDGSAYFNNANSAWYAQDQWAVTPRLTLTGGLRADIAMFLTEIPYNAPIDSAYGRRTDAIPKTTLQWSPRFGFNWDITGNAVNQLRGGVGIFVGTPPGVWLENAVINSGSVQTFLNCNTSGSTAQSPSFSLDPSVVNQCRTGNPVKPIGDVNFLAKDLKYPQPLRFSLAYDRRIGENVVATVEGLYGRTLNQLFMVNLNLNQPRGVDPHGRVLFGDTILTTGAARPSIPAKIIANGGTTRFSTAFDMINQSNDYFYNLTFKLERRYSDNWQGVVAYTFGHAYDVQSFSSSTAVSNWRFGRTLSTDQFKADRGTSNFDQPHNIMAQGTYTFHWWKNKVSTDVTLFYRGNSGSPHDYVYNGAGGAGDLNADGAQGNDLFYVPTNALDATQIRFNASGTITAAQQAQALEDFINSSECLKSQRGQIMKRNSCRNPWQEQMDLTVRQSLPEFIGGQRGSFMFQIYNVMNLINDEWGKQKQTDGSFNSNVPLLTHVGMSSIDPKTAVPIFTHNVNQRTYIKNNGVFDNYRFQAGFRYSW